MIQTLLDENPNIPFIDQARKRAPTFFAALDSSDSGYAERQKAQEAKEASRQIHDRLKSFADEIGSRYDNATLETYEPATKSQRMALDAIKAHSTGVCAFSENIVLYGPCGSGKDHLLIGLAKKAIAKGMTVRWVFGVDLFREMRDAIGTGSSEREVIASLVRPDILILSDPAPPDASVTDHQRSTLLSVLDQRYRKCKPTWSTINATNRDEAIDRLGGQSVDRLWTDASQIFVNAPSHRFEHE